MRAPSRLVIFAGGILLVLFVAVPSAAQDPGVGLGALAGPSALLTDSNGDAVVDAVRGRVVLPDSAREAEVTAAANLAARLGYETAAADLRPTVSASTLGPTPERPVLFVGRAGPDVPSAPRLGPGQGRVAVVPPSDRVRAGGLRVRGGDASGLLAAATYASGRLPALWRLGGPTAADVVAGVRDTLRAGGLAPDTVRARHVTVGTDRPGVHTLGLHVRLPDSAAAARTDSLLRPAGGTTTDGHPLHVPAVRSVVVQVAHPDGASRVRARPATPWEPEPLPEADRPVDRTPELHELYSLDGLYDDTNHDLVPDDVVGAVSYDGSAASRLAEPLSALSMRVGLETAGARWPLVHPAGGGASAAARGLPVLVGTDHPAVAPLRGTDRLPGPAPEAGEGALRVLEDGPENRPAIVADGGDAAGLASVLDYAARRLPRLGGHGKNAFRLQRVDTAVRRFVQGKSGAGQVAAGLEKLDTWLARLDTTAVLDSLHVTLAADSVPGGLERYIRGRVRSTLPNAAVGTETIPTRYGVGRPVLEQEWDIPWEGDTFWRLFREQVVPAMGPGDAGRIELRLSEGPAVRARLTRKIRAALAERGVDTTAVDVSVLSAYKQGYSWLVDEVAPAVAGREVGRVAITYHTLEESGAVRWQEIDADARWLQALYPVDAVLARELGIADSLVTFESRWAAEPTYAVDVLGPAGDTLHTDTFDPRYTVRPYVDYFPKHDSVRVPTGGLRVTMDGDTLVDRRIRTDLERFWTRFQAETVPKIAAYAMDVQDGRPRPENAPFFDELRMHVRLSEPNYRLGLQEHTISATEALHEDLYFHGLTLFTLLGNRYNVGPLDYPGRILPRIRPPAPGSTGHARIEMTGKAEARPELRLAYTTEAGRRTVKTYPLPNIENVPAPELRGLRTRVDRPGVSGLRFDVETETDTSVYAAMRARGGEAAIDRAYPSSERLQGMARHLRRLQEQGLFVETLSYDRVGAIRLRLVPDDSAAPTRTTRLPRTDAPRGTDLPSLPAAGPGPDVGPLVQWETPIPPAEANQILGTLGPFPEVHPYYMETSFLGHDIFAVDLRPPQGGAHVSQATLNARRPTLYLNAREDGNEVSSTSYVLRLAEQVATDPAVRTYLDSVGVTILPVSNPDGAQEAYERQRVNPDFMLHSGYYAALGPSMGAQADETDPIYPEATVEPRLRRHALPDIFMNLHGYPSHEWVQYFSGYSAWVFNRTGTARSWWAPRGYFLTGYDWVDDTDHSELKTAAFTALDSLTAALSRRDTLMALSREEYRRYRKYRSVDEDYGEYFRNGVRVHSALKGHELEDGPPTDVRDPRITPFSITTEAQDETARGEWLRLQAGAGLSVVTAALRYLYHGTNTVVREAETTDGTVRRWVYREKPVLPPGAGAADE
jgi:hypothetical protein